MQRQAITAKQGVMLIAMYVIGTTFLLSIGVSAKRDLWIAYLIALAVSLLLVIVYGRIMSHLPGQDFYGILEKLIGKVWSRVILIPMVVCLFQTASNIMREFAQFVDMVGIPDAPPLVPYLGIGIVAALAVYFGIEILGRWSEFFLPVVILFIISFTLLLIPYAEPDHMRPTLENGWTPVIKGAWEVISLPLAQTVVFLFVFPPFKKRKTPMKVFPLGLGIGALMVSVTSVMDGLVLGLEMESRLYYPTYLTLSIVRLGQFIQRLEIVAATVFTLTVFLKAAILMIAVCKALGFILGLDDHRFLALPVMLIIINYAYIPFPNTVLFYRWTVTIWPYYSSFFQILIPMVLFFILEYRMARMRKKKDNPLQPSI